MSTDRLLTSVLRLYQDVHDAAQTERIFGITTTLLANLSNPLNLSLLTSQFLTAPAIWNHPDGLRTYLRVVSIYNTAAIHVRRNEQDRRHHRGTMSGGGLGVEAWARAVAKGADDRSARWQHLLIFTGVLMGLEGDGRQSLSSSMRSTVEQAVVTAANLALETDTRDGPLSAQAIVLGLNYAFPLLSESNRAQVNCNALLPIALDGMLGDHGFQAGPILGNINADILRFNNQLQWPQTSRSFLQLQQLESQPLVAGAGPLSKLVAHTVQHVHDARAVLQAQDAISTFAEALSHRWSTSSNLSGFDSSLEAEYLHPQTMQATWPVLWQFLKRILYSSIVVLQAIVARSLLDPQFQSGGIVTSTAVKSLHILRHLYFISSRPGASTFQLYTFTYLASIDIIVRQPEVSTSFLEALAPILQGRVPPEPRQATEHLFYLNVAEHFAAALSPKDCDSLILQPAMLYLAPPDGVSSPVPVSARMVELYEAAHSAVLSVLSNPHNAPITVGIAPFYAQALFSSFPSRISPRQFRVAFKTMMQVLSPPFPVSATHPELAETLLEMVRLRVGTAGITPLPEGPEESTEAAPRELSGPVSEQSTLVLTMIDALPFLALGIVEEWMTVTAETMWDIRDAGIREVAKRRFWEVLVSGEMDVERAAIGVAWWGMGGSDRVLHGRPGASQPLYLMSGAIVDEQGPSRL